MKNPIKELACGLVAVCIMVCGLVGLVLYCLLGGVICLDKREARPRE